MNQTGTAIAIVSAAIITAAVSIYIYTDDKDERIKIIEKSREEKKSVPVPTPSLYFTEVFVTPVDTKISSSFFMEISNFGSAVARNFFLRIDFGESTPQECEWIPNNVATLVGNTDSVIKEWDVSKLEKKQSIYIVCLISSPFFKSISMGGGNVENNINLTYEAYKERGMKESLSYYEILWRIVFVVMVIMFFIWLIGVIWGEKDNH